MKVIKLFSLVLVGTLFFAAQKSSAAESVRQDPFLYHNYKNAFNLEKIYNNKKFKQHLKNSGCQKKSIS